MKRIGWLFLLVIALFASCTIGFAADLSWNSKEFMGVDEIKPGMVGYGKTVYQGTKIETFNVQVIGILKKMDFGFDMILIKVTSGPVVDRKLQTVEGMSGSPIYINNRLIGAYAYGWDFQQEPIAGVTPIATMLECTQPGSSTPKLTGALAPADRVFKIGDRLISRVRVAATHTDAAALQAKADPTTMVLAPAASPLFVSGMSDASIQPLKRLFDQYNLRVTPGPGQIPGPPTKLQPGSAVAVSLMDGDVNLSAIGTVTYVKGDTVLAFGHSFLEAGKVNMPMATAYVQGIINSGKSSFKLAGPMETVGTLTSDRQYAVGGTIGKKPHTLPVSLHLSDTSRKLSRGYAVNVVHDQTFTPTLLYSYILSRGASDMADFATAEGTYVADMTLNTDKLGALRQTLTISPLLSPIPKIEQRPMPMGEFYLLVDALMQNPYESVAITDASVDISYQPERNIAEIEEVIPDKLVVRPGEKVNLVVKIRPYGKPVETKTVTVSVPKYSTDNMMALIIAGGGNGIMLKQITDPTPTPQEGIKGIARWLTNLPPAHSLLSAQLLPTLSYAYRGQVMNEVPAPLMDVLRTTEPNGGIQAGDDSSSGNSRPTIISSFEKMPYLLLGGQAIVLAIDSPEQHNSGKGNVSASRIHLPVLSSSSVAATPGEDGASPDEAMHFRLQFMDWYRAMRWFTPQQRERQALLLGLPTTAQDATFGFMKPLAFGQSLTGMRPADITPSSDDEPEEGETEQAETAQKNGPNFAANDTASEDSSPDEMSDDGSANEESGDTGLLTRKLPSWGLTNRNAFMRGQHLGTTVTSKGSLVLAPQVSSIYRTADLTPWKMVSTANGTYLAGWGKNIVLCVTEQGETTTVFPSAAIKNLAAESISGLAADADGNLLVATWPDQHVYLISPDGTLLREWMLPAENIWDLAVASNGKRYAACNNGMLYLLQDDANAPLQVGAIVPDTQVYTLAPGPEGAIYFATSPRGKVYRLDANGALSAVYEAKRAVSSLAVDADGTVYVGTSPNCSVYRISPDGTHTAIMTGMGNGNRHILALKLVGNDLYATTGPIGGIYRIKNPKDQEPEVTAILARDDTQRGEDDEAVTGPESTFINALALSPNGDLLAAGASPAQVLRLTPRDRGAFVSAVLPCPAVSKWGQVDVHGAIGDSPLDRPNNVLNIETRTGRTGWPDTTWSAWQPLRADQFIASPSATYAQIRVTLAGESALQYIRAHYQPVNLAPMAKIAEPAAGAYWSGKKDIRWMGKDPDSDTLIYTAFVSADQDDWGIITMPGKEESAPKAAPAPEPEQKTDNATADKEKKAKKKSKKADNKDASATPVAETVTETPEKPTEPEPVFETDKTEVPWDTTTVPDGVYSIKVIASDRYARPDDPKSFAATSGRFTVDNTAPTVDLPETVDSFKGIMQFTISDNLTPIIGGKYRIDGGPWVALVAQDGVFDSKEEVVMLVSPLGAFVFSPKEHKLEIMAKDAADNELKHTVTITAPAK